MPVEMYPLQLPLFSWLCMHTVSHINLNTTVCAPAPRHYAERTRAHTHTPISKHVMTLIHAQLGDVKHRAKVSQGRHFPGGFSFGERVECQRQAQGVGLHRAARACQSEGHGGITW